MLIQLDITDDAPRTVTADIEDWSSLDILAAYHAATPQLNDFTALYFTPFNDFAVIIGFATLRAFVSQLPE